MTNTCNISTTMMGLTSPTRMTLAGSICSLTLLGGWLYWRRGTRRPVPRRVEQEVQRTLNADPNTEPVIVEGALRLQENTRLGVALRLAIEVKHEMGGITPAYTEANRMVATRRIDDVMTAHGVTRRIDRAMLAPKIRALVFTRLKGELEEAQWVNSAAAQSSHDAVNGWGAYLARPGEWLRSWRSRAPGVSA